MNEWISLIMKDEELPFFDPTFKKIFMLSTKTFRKVFLSFLDSFGELGFKTSFYFKEDRKIIFQIWPPRARPSSRRSTSRFGRI